MSVVLFVDALLFGVLAPLVPGYAEEFGLSKTGAGLLVGAFGAGALLGGIPGGLAAARRGPKIAVVAGLTLLAASSFAFALAEGPWALGIARFVQAPSSTTTWAGALAWLTVATPRERRGELLGTAFGAAVLGAILGPMFGAVADAVGVRGAFSTVGAITAALALWAATRPAAAPQTQAPNAVRRAFADRSFPRRALAQHPARLALRHARRARAATARRRRLRNVRDRRRLPGRRRHRGGRQPAAGLASDRRGRLLPVRVALATSIVIAIAFAVTRDPYAVAFLTILAAISFGAFYTPGMALVSDRTELAGLSQAIGFGIMNTAWALGNMSGPSLAGVLAEAGGDALPYLLAATLCLVTLLATGSARAPSARRVARGDSSVR